MDDNDVVACSEINSMQTRQGPPAPQSLRSKGSCGKHIVAVNPFRCRVWSLHDRLEEHITEESCAEEIQSVASHGQLIPALGRPLVGDLEHDVEIICGARRLFVARHINVPLHVELREMSDRNAIVAMDLENRHRKDLSAYERGLSYAHWLRGKYFGSQDDLARALNVSASQVSRLLKLSQLPSVVLSAFPSPMAIRECWGLDLHKAWHDPQLRPLVALRARGLGTATSRTSAKDVYRRLMAPAGTRTARKHGGHDEVVVCPEGTPLFRIRRHRKFIALLLPVDRMSENSLKRIRTAVSEELRQPSEKGSAATDSIS
jgi:ParB family chromosome partitioning protein